MTTTVKVCNERMRAIEDALQIRDIKGSLDVSRLADVSGRTRMLGAYVKWLRKDFGVWLDSSKSQSWLATFRCARVCLCLSLCS